MNRTSLAAIAASVLLAAAVSPAFADPLVRPVSERFAVPEVKEVPDFQRHVLPLMGRLGCNGRACHGSFQGQGGFQLSLFGYDFKMDHDALLKKDSGRVDPEAADLSKILQKPTLTIPHKGGKRMDVDSWQYQVLFRWIDGGAKGVTEPSHFERLEVTPAEIVFQREGETVPLRVVAHWADGTREDVTCITRFRTNNESIAEINEDGVVTSKGQGDTHVVAFYDNGVAATQVILPVSDRVGPKYPDVPTPTKIDELVVAKLRKLGIVPSELCTDEEFLRRISLDLTGTLPTPKEVETFLAESSSNKRAAKVDELLERPTYAAWWATQLCDITGDSRRNFQGQVAAEEMARHWYEWIERRVKENTPYDELVAGIVLGTSRAPGQDFDDFIKQQSTYYRAKNPADFTARNTMPYYWAKRTARKAEEKALNFSYTFLGVRLECAQCHKHPFDQWTQDDFNRFTAFFDGVRYGTAPDARQRTKELNESFDLPKNGGQARKQLSLLVRKGEVIPWQEVYIVPKKPARPGKKQTKKVSGASRVITPKVLGGDEVDLEGSQDPRKPLMDWMRSPENPYFARAFINRVWANDFGSGIVNPPDDMNQANPPSNAALLDYLTSEFVARGFDMKWLHREILTSQTYQRSWRSNETNGLDERNFSRAVIRRLPAEVLIDAMAQANADSDALARVTTDLEDRSIGPKAGGGGIGRRGGDYASRVFGVSTRDSNCDCNRSNEPNLLQSIYLQNDQETLAALDRRDGWLAERAKAANVKPTGTKGEIDNLTRRIDDLERRFKKLQDGGRDKPAEKVKTQLVQARKSLKTLRDAENDTKQEAETASASDVESLVREAYLRTLSRPPSSSETARARAYFVESDDASDALRDLLWALLNTKEFITNH